MSQTCNQTGQSQGLFWQDPYAMKEIKFHFTINILRKKLVSRAKIRWAVKHFLYNFSDDN